MAKTPSKFDKSYPVKKEFHRFDQCNTAFNRETLRNPKSSDPRILELSPVTKSSDSLPGYRLIDYAFKDAAFTVAHQTQSGYGHWNSGLYSWNSLGVTKKPENIVPWHGTTREANRILTRAAKYYGATHVGFCERDDRWFYSHDQKGREIIFDDQDEWTESSDSIGIPNRIKSIIVLTVPMEFDEIRFAPTALNPTSNMGYSRMAALAGSMSEFIRGLGWLALPLGNDTALSVPMAIQAGIGHAGRFGRVISWDRGPMIRILKILTDLPISPSKMAPEGIRRFCDSCKKCAYACPSQAISHGERTFEGRSPANNPGIYKWYVNADACLQYWRKIKTSCGICFRVCPFSRSNSRTQRFIRWMIQHIPTTNRFWSWFDSIRGLDKQANPQGYWE